MGFEPCKVLIGSAIRQKPAILKEFLISLQELDTSGLEVDFLFVDNNDEEESSLLLQGFRMAGSILYLAREKPDEAYLCTEESHYWKESLIWRVAAYKNAILEFARENNYDYVFMVDSDLVLHPLTLKQLLSSGKDIISEIFWTEWLANTVKLPQVWCCGEYSYAPNNHSLSKEEKNRQAQILLSQLQTPGIYEVGGLGACTLISYRAISRGVSYSKISNLDYRGEDRHFCVRAAVLGFRLFVDTHYPAFHIYRESDLPGVKLYKRKWHEKQISGLRFFRKTADNKLTLSMAVRNEADRYLKMVLEHARQYIDAAVIIDDASTDGTADLCRQILNGIPLVLVENHHSCFKNEVKLRKQQWEETVKTNPDWILFLDADEVFEDRIITEIGALINQDSFDYVAFRLYDFWDKDHYREDSCWQAHYYYRPFLIRYLPGFSYRWKETPLHCGRMPYNVTELPGINSFIRLKHFGWADPESRARKYKWYLKADPEGKYGVLQQYLSIMDEHPNLVKWED